MRKAPCRPAGRLNRKEGDLIAIAEKVEWRAVNPFHPYRIQYVADGAKFPLALSVQQQRMISEAPGEARIVEARYDNTIARRD